MAQTQTMPPPTDAVRRQAAGLIPSSASCCRHTLGFRRKVGMSCTVGCRFFGRLVMQKRMTPFAVVLRSLDLHGAWRHCATRHSGRHARKQAAVHAGLSASANRADAHCRGSCGACMCGQMMFSFSCHPPKVQTFSRCRGRRFEQPLQPVGKRGSDPAATCLAQVRPSWHGAELTRAPNGAC